MIDKIKEIYERIDNDFLLTELINNVKSRSEFKRRLENEILDIGISQKDYLIKCDEENNSPEVIDYSCLVATVFWIEKFQYKYCNLIFGQAENVIKFQSLL
jgi:hypothetical protein